LSAIKKFGGVDKDLMVLTTEFDSSSINFNIRFWIKYPENPATSMRSKAIKTIKKSLMNKILPSLPIRHWTLELGLKTPKWN
jgi:small conductance mechanosensitive channel